MAPVLLFYEHVRKPAACFRDFLRNLARFCLRDPCLEKNGRLGGRCSGQGFCPGVKEFGKCALGSGFRTALFSASSSLLLVVVGFRLPVYSLEVISFFFLHAAGGWPTPRRGCSGAS